MSITPRDDGIYAVDPHPTAEERAMRAGLPPSAASLIAECDDLEVDGDWAKRPSIESAVDAGVEPRQALLLFTSRPLQRLALDFGTASRLLAPDAPLSPFDEIVKGLGEAAKSLDKRAREAGWDGEARELRSAYDGYRAALNRVYPRRFLSAPSRLRSIDPSDAETRGVEIFTHDYAALDELRPQLAAAKARIFAQTSTSPFGDTSVARSCVLTILAPLMTRANQELLGRVERTLGALYGEEHFGGLRDLRWTIRFIAAEYRARAWESAFGALHRMRIKPSTTNAYRLLAEGGKDLRSVLESFRYRHNLLTQMMLDGFAREEASLRSIALVHELRESAILLGLRLVAEPSPLSSPPPDGAPPAASARAPIETPVGVQEKVELCMPSPNRHLWMHGRELITSKKDRLGKLQPITADNEFGRYLLWMALRNPTVGVVSARTDVVGRVEKAVTEACKAANKEPIIGIRAGTPWPPLVIAPRLKTKLQKAGLLDFLSETRVALPVRTARREGRK